MEPRYAGREENTFVSEGQGMIIGTAGHIDHGKTSLVRALTGMETDRLAEEKRRGMSIDLGFAYMGLPGGRQAGIVDVPGHEDFVRNMLAGIQGIDVALLVIAADDGAMPQTREHLDIIDLLGIDAGIVALTKIDLVDGTRRAEAESEIRVLLKETALRDAGIVSVSSTTGEGIDQLKEKLAGLAETVVRQKGNGFFRMPVDRVFSIKGIGTVATGTVLSGALSTGETVRLFPGGREIRARQMEAYGNPAERLEAGMRGAVNLAGLEKGEVKRGDLLASPFLKRETSFFHAAIRPARFSGKTVRPGERVHLHIGTADLIASVFPTEGAFKGGGGFASFRLSGPISLLRGDRFVVRDYSARQTLGGGVALDPFPARQRSREREKRFRLFETGSVPALAEDLIETAGGVEEIARLSEHLNLPPDTLLAELGSSAGLRRAGETLVLERRLKEIEAAILPTLKEMDLSGKGVPYETLRRKTAGKSPAALFREAIDNLLERKAIEKPDEATLRLKGQAVRRSPQEETARRKLLAGLTEKGYQTASCAELAGQDRKLLSNLSNMVREGEVVQLSKDNFIPRDLLENSKKLLLAHFEKKGTISVIEFKDILQTGRKGAILILEHFDKTHLTVRRGDERVLTGRGLK